MTKADSKKAGNTPMLLTLLANFITSVVLAYSIACVWHMTGQKSLSYALIASFLAWLAFSMTTLLTHNSFELKAPKLTVISGSY